MLKKLSIIATASAAGLATAPLLAQLSQLEGISGREGA
jgi:hypothetical protein